MEKYLKDPISSLTHFGGMIASIPVLILLLVRASHEGKTLNIVTLSVFGCSLILLYGASGIYHMVKDQKLSNILRRIDHMMIFVLIAGTYTPICLVCLKGPIGIGYCILAWTLAISGIILKIFYINAPNWLCATIYMFMGWIVAFVLYPLSKTIAPESFKIFITGGVFYSIGALIYALKWPNLNKKMFGFHELFHVFILIGSFFHVMLMFKEIL